MQVQGKNFWDLVESMLAIELELERIKGDLINLIMSDPDKKRRYVKIDWSGLIKDFRNGNLR